ncbi:LacI family DNA-binding transcriptional regulator [Myceligenerans salitolerans]|uniref:LacI family DNA-binding transcriptional regulator n=1 Tax=Myceligenerans salitolerans TaxID=1230528 RepID=A0ABS3IDG3_9MICO|nr:LacI family DNA-binding transcriptional regulator [Myceligenerans salitolerans]MBO0611080.1 LacI family DNA-binding transcriptional regulator [Myceligenerans salitolerans]
MRDTRTARPTLETVARLAGVSRATVSRVINGSEGVTPGVREAVDRAVEQLGYVPNPAARSLVSRRTDSIALVVPEPAARMFSDDAFFTGILRGIGQELDAADKQLVLLLASTPANHGRITRYLRARTVDGVILASLHGADPFPSELAAMGVPAVASGRPLSGGVIPYIDVDHVGGVRAAVEHLLAQGRKRIATIAGPQDMVAGIDRLAGYRGAVAAAGMRSLVEIGDFTRESGTTAMRRLLDDEPAIDAVFVASDLMAEGALRTLRRERRRVPEDVAVVGFDDATAARSTEPPLTTVRQPIHETGRMLAQQVLRLASGESVEPAVILPTELVLRESA